MTAEQIERLNVARLKYSEILQRHDRELQEQSAIIRDVINNCDHVIVDGTSAVQTGLGGTFCDICHTNNDYGCLDEHLRKHHGWPIPKRDDWGMIIQ